MAFGEAPFIENETHTCKPIIFVTLFELEYLAA